MPPVDLNYNFSVNLQDADGDTVSHAMSVFLPGNVTTGGLLVEGLTGTGHADTLMGTTGADVLIGGAGNDVLTGHGGADVFKWSLGDEGSKFTPASDQITDFTIVQGNGAGNNVLDLRDLLMGEHDGSVSGIANVNNLTQYLHFDTVNGKAVLEINHDASASPATTPDQTIIFNNYADVNALANALGAASSSDADIIKQMLANHNLKVDG